MSLYSENSDFGGNTGRFSLRCPRHTSEEYTNFCCIKYCLTALCPECIDDHNKDHKLRGEFPEIDTLKRVLKMCVKQIMTSLTVVEEELNRIKRFSNMSMDQIIQELNKEIESSRANMHKAVDAFYQDLVTDYETNLKKSLSKTFNFKDLEKELKMAHEELETLDYQLKTDKFLVEAVKRVCSLDMSRFVLFYQEKVQKVLGQGFILPFEINFKERDFPTMHNFLSQYVVMKQKMVGVSNQDLEQHRQRDINLKLENEEAARYFNSKLKHY